MFPCLISPFAYKHRIKREVHSCTLHLGFPQLYQQSWLFLFNVLANSKRYRQAELTSHPYRHTVKRYQSHTVRLRRLETVAVGCSERTPAEQQHPESPCRLSRFPSLDSLLEWLMRFFPFPGHYTSCWNRGLRSVFPQLRPLSSITSLKIIPCLIAFIVFSQSSTPNQVFKTASPEASYKSMVHH